MGDLPTAERVDVIFVDGERVTGRYQRISAPGIVGAAARDGKHFAPQGQR
jgi:hypothetical protein